MDVSNASVRPPILDSSGKNYSLWKTRMTMYIKSIDERAWVVVLDGWTPPRVTDDVGNITPKPESQWSADERLISSHNSRALKAIFISVDVPCFRMISNCVEARDAWFILQEKCEGLTSVRVTKLRMLTTKFEIFRMHEDETILTYYEKLCEISNEAVDLEEPINNKRLVSKMLRSLPERYNMKISSIEETADVTSIRIGDLVSMLVAFETNLEQQKPGYYPKNVVFHVDKSASTIDVTDNVESADVDLEDDDDVNLVMLAKNFNNMMKSLKKAKNKSGGKRMSMGSSSNICNVKSNYISPASEIINGDNIQCRGCQGMGHYANECPTVARKRQAGLTPVLCSFSKSEEEQFLWSATINEDELSEARVIEVLEELDVISDVEISDDVTEPDLTNVGDNVDNIVSNIQDVDDMEISTNTTNWYEIIFLGKINTNIPDVSCTAVVEEQVIDPLKEMENNEALYEEVDNQCGELMNDLCLLLDENQKSKDEVTRIEGLLTQCVVELGKLNDEVVSVERTFEHLNKGTSDLNEVLSQVQTGQCGLGYITEGLSMLNEHHNTTVYAKERNIGVIMENVTNIGFSHKEKSKRKLKSYACHYCSTSGHIKPYSVKCLSDVDDLSDKQMFDSYQTNVSNISRFVFGAMSNTEKDDEPCNVIYIFLHANISDSWYFDSGCSRYMTGSKALLTDYVSTNGGNITFRAGMLVKFDKNICEVFDNINQCVMMCRRSSDISYKFEDDNICNVTKLNDVKLWHQRLGHADLKNLQKLIANDVIRGLPKFVIKRDVVCQPCQKGQQLRTAYPMLSTCNTTRCFELLHMNLMSPIEVESLGGKRYVLVCAYEYSKYTWVAFIKIKSETFCQFDKLYKKFCAQYGMNVGRIIIYHGKAFENLLFDDFCTNHCFLEYSTLKIPYQTSVAVWKNMILQEIMRAMLHAKSLSKCLWTEAVNTACHIIYRGYLRPDDEDVSVILEEHEESEQTSEQRRNVNVDPTSDATSNDSTPEPESVENTSDPMMNREDIFFMTPAGAILQDMLERITPTLSLLVMCQNKCKLERGRRPATKIW
ncbi:uncharacterized protein LOC131008067 [Salvia miltiorrhiza]|uniref:uncharacterized protein LOC131008067 n=1 Tax=Salvia miltiorrhiza TaxID=226208 RepID=UPI0025AC5EBA|nr:uncharacterized protein LOC131008067 [Salvia miltiorrhiza]